jgi:tetratricopeptide (TPR) repeat protein
VTEPLYERYKDALRRGHVAALRGRDEAAMTAYAEAVRLAPDRPLPHTSLGSTYLRLGRADEALAAFDAALSRAPADEGALAGRSDALVSLARPAQAAATLDRLAETLEGAGRLAEACDTACRALELAESRPRRRYVEELVARLRAAEPDDASSAVLARAGQVLERETARSTRAARSDAGGDAPSGGGPDDEPVAVPPDASSPGAADAGALSTAPLPSVDPEALLRDAEVALEGGDAAAARMAFTQAIDAHRRRGEANAALDAAARALTLDPLAPDLHLALADLYLARGWRTLAADKLVLVARLAALSADDETTDRVRAVARAQFADHDALDRVLATPARREAAVTADQGGEAATGV